LDIGSDVSQNIYIYIYIDDSVFTHSEPDEIHLLTSCLLRFPGFCWIEPSGISTYLHQGAVEGKNASSLPVDVGQYLILILFVGGFARLQGETQRDFLNSES